ncbi:hypothetical protein CRYUN_Cryun18bG0141600 [Craigia yunnanensis]
MANVVLQLQLPTSNLRNFAVYASSNEAPSGTGSQNGGPVVLELPLDKIRRPLMSTRANDPNKVQELMNSIREIGLQVPIDVLEVDGVYYVSLVVIVMRLTSALGSQQSVAKYDEELKKLSGIIFAEWWYMLLKCIDHAFLSSLQVQCMYILNVFRTCLLFKFVYYCFNKLHIASVIAIADGNVHFFFYRKI